MPNPKLQAARDLFSLINRNVEAAPDAAAIAQETVEAVKAAGLYGVSAPREVGGEELSIPEAIEVFAELARADGSVGWSVMAGAVLVSYFGAYCDQDFVDQMFGAGMPIGAGQFAPNGTGVPDGDDFVISGKYQFGSGISHANWVGAGVFVTPAEGDPELRFMVFPRECADVQGNWDVLGLQSTSSFDYEVKDVRVPRGATFPFFGPTRRRGGKTYELGVLPLTAVGHVGFALGVARRALDELIDIARTKQRMGATAALRDSDLFLDSLGTLESRYRACSSWSYDVFGKMEHTVRETGIPNPVEMNLARQATVFVTHEAADVIRQAYLLAGTSGLRAGPLQRCFRDIHAGTQHFFASPAATADMARDLLA
ncbi:MAG: acyl-CoA dehydrogenase family protein [Candidatus Binatia bacterium]|nr:acyl-CoA dehydrogenase family protein [Candidatus Binatia bacterium]